MKARIGRGLALLLTLTICVSFIAGCGSNTSQNSQQNSQQNSEDSGSSSSVTEGIDSIVRFGRDWPTYYDPGVGSSYTCSIAQTNIYDALVFANPDGSVSPHVAKEWTVSEDGTVYTFYLRDDVKFHTGNILTAHDVEYSFKRLMDIGQSVAYLYKDIYKDCRAVDDYTFEFTLNYAFGPFVNTLPRFFILEKALVEEHTDLTATTYGENGDYGTNWLLTHDAGSGPYKTVEFKLEEYLLGEKFDDYFLGWEEDAPQYFMLSNMNDPVAQRTAFANQELELSSDSLPQETYAELEEMGGELAVRTGTGVWSILLNTKMAPTDDINFRKALAYAFDYDTVVSDILPGTDKVTGPVTDFLFGKNKDLEGYYFDMEKAQEYLMKSKYADDPSQWVVTMSWCAEIPEQEKITLMFQAALQQLGITLEVTKKPFSAMTADAQTIETTPNASIVQWTPNYLEAGDVFKTRYHSDSTGTWEQMEWLLDDKLDAMIDDALATADNGEREKKYQEIEQYIFDLCPTIWMADNTAKFVTQPYVEWPILTYYKNNIPNLSIVGYDLWFHDFKVHVDQKNK